MYSEVVMEERKKGSIYAIVHMNMLFLISRNMTDRTEAFANRLNNIKIK